MTMAWTRTALIGGLAAAAIGATLAWAFWPKPSLVETGEVTRGVFRASVEEYGRTRIRNRYVVTAPLAGRMLRSTLKVGDAVRQGSVVATLLPSLPPLLETRTRRELEERVGAAEATVQETQARLERATEQEAQNRADADRMKTLNRKGISSAQQLEREELALRLAQRDREAAQLRRHAAEHELAQAKALLARYNDQDSVDRWDVTAPVDGRVLRISQESETVAPSGAPLVELGDPHDLEIIVDLLTTDAVEVRPGADVVIDRWGGPEPLAGKVRLVEPAGFTKVSALGVEEQRVWVVVDITSPRSSWAGLGDAFRVDVRIAVAEIQDATLAPANALFRRGDGWAAFVIEGGRARERAVQVIRRTVQVAAVAQGLAAGDRLVVFPPTSLVDGGRVTPR
ncbi:secretion protein HlyD [Alsobacter metallidurans]|uniref:Secretion protein HlyD n=1 Tax=Alsobacter metallidurans TaxID=340221 RepID=A0A917IC24_9HYPH|nr:HlyD family efflux transporter periplasmic adaptor subunit [Alsobacter metallidurans]GGH33180.1 secretion protein HlyD [Alsobacter metallidurans]